MKKTKRRTQKARFSFSSDFFARKFIAKSLSGLFCCNFCTTFAPKVALFCSPAWTCQQVFSFLENLLESERERSGNFLLRNSESLCECSKGKQLVHLSSSSHKCTQDMAIKPPTCFMLQKICVISLQMSWIRSKLKLARVEGWYNYLRDQSTLPLYFILFSSSLLFCFFRSL